MRQVTMVTLVASFVVLILQCSTNESLAVFSGRMETVTAPIKKAYPFAPYAYCIITDSIKWVYEYPSGGPTRVSIILSGIIKTDSIVPPPSWFPSNPPDSIDVGIGQSHLDLGLETYSDSGPVIVQLAFDSVGGFLDTSLIAVSQSSGMILPASSRLIAKIGDYPFDTIRLVDPHAAGGQQ